MNVFNLYHCCSSATSAITMNSNPEPYSPTHRISCSSVSSSASRKQTAVSSYNVQRSSISSSILPRSNSYLNNRASSHKIKQTTIWSQQEKAFRQLFAIVFGFTCCFLPYFILYMVVAFCGSCVSERILTATIWLGYVNSTINPFLYALSNKHFRRTFNRILKRDQRRQSYYNWLADVLMRPFGFVSNKEFCSTWPYRVWLTRMRFDVDQVKRRIRSAHQCRQLPRIFHSRRDISPPCTCRVVFPRKWRPMGVPMTRSIPIILTRQKKTNPIFTKSLPDRINSVPEIKTNSKHSQTEKDVPSVSVCTDETYLSVVRWCKN